MTGFADVNLSLIAPLIIVWAVLLTIALTSCIKAEETNGPKWMWVLIIVGISMFGPIAYFVIGRKQH